MPAFEKVGECLYRYTPTGMYYGRFEVAGKEVRRSLETTDRALAKRRLAAKRDELARVNLAAGKSSLGDLIDRYMATVQNQKPKTVRRKRDIAVRVKADFPGGVAVPITKVKASDVSAWLAGYTFGAASFNLYLEFVRAVFALAVHDRVLAASPIEHLKGKRPAKPIRQTPSMEEFRAIVADIRPARSDPGAGSEGHDLFKQRVLVFDGFCEPLQHTTYRPFAVVEVWNLNFRRGHDRGQ